MPVPNLSARKGNFLIIIRETCSRSILVGKSVYTLIALQMSLVNSFLLLGESALALSSSLTAGEN